MVLTGKRPWPLWARGDVWSSRRETVAVHSGCERCIGSVSLQWQLWECETHPLHRAVKSNTGRIFNTNTVAAVNGAVQSDILASDVSSGKALILVPNVETLVAWLPNVSL